MFMVVSLCLASASPLLTSQGQTERCHHSAPLGTSTVTHSHEADCGHAHARHCTLLGCVIIGPALTSPQVLLSALSTGNRVVSAGSSHLVVRLTTGPPTPPPNS